MRGVPPNLCAAPVLGSRHAPCSCCQLSFLPNWAVQLVLPCPPRLPVPAAGARWTSCCTTQPSGRGTLRSCCRSCAGAATSPPTHLPVRLPALALPPACTCPPTMIGKCHLLRLLLPASASSVVDSDPLLVSCFPVPQHRPRHALPAHPQHPAPRPQASVSAGFSDCCCSCQRAGQTVTGLAPGRQADCCLLQGLPPNLALPALPLALPPTMSCLQQHFCGPRADDEAGRLWDGANRG